MGGEFVALDFFVPLAARPPSDDALVDLLGCDRAKMVFGPLDVAEIVVDTLSHHVCVRLCPLRRAFFDLVGEKDAADRPRQQRGIQLAIAIRDGAARANAEVATLVTERHLLGDLGDLYARVVARDLDSLVRESHSVVYFDDELARDWEPAPGVLDGRDELPEPGRTIFVWEPARWF